MTVTISGTTGITTPANTVSGSITFGDSSTQSTAPYSTAALAAQFASSLSANGYQKLPSGLIIQWGSVGYSAAPDISVTVTFPIAFTASFYVAGVLGLVTASGDGRLFGTASIGAPSTTSFSIVLRNNVNAGSSTGIIYWYAVGK